MWYPSLESMTKQNGRGEDTFGGPELIELGEM